MILFGRRCRSVFLFFVVCALASFAVAQPDESGLISNGTPAEIAAVTQLLSRLDAAVTAREANSLRFFGLEKVAAFGTLQAQTRATHMAFSPAGALVRQAFRIIEAKNPAFLSNNSAPNPLAEGIHEIWLPRAGDGSFSFSDKRWSAPYDAVAALTEAAREEWERPTTGRSSPLLHLVAARRGGRWAALRRSRWDGAILDARNLARFARTQTISRAAPLDAAWLRARMEDAPDNESGVGHFILQKTASGWVGIGMAWESDHRLSAENDAAASEARRQILGAAYALPTAHRALGLAMGQVGFFNEAADELEKAETLQPGIVGAALLKQVNATRPRDPEKLAATQLQNEARVGLDPNHPYYLVEALYHDYKQDQSVLRALRLGLEYSRLADDERAAAWLRAAQELVGQGALRDVSVSDSQWIQVLSEHLEERRALSAQKPSNTIRSPLFTLRCWPNDLAAVQVLASLEAAQHTVYADFGIPMSTTEVLLWRTQNEFQSYVTRFSSQGNSEFVAALTLTKLIATREGPVVLGEEINVFTDARTPVFSTVAHEYGHVAVRQITKGRDVPTWLNEGVATSVEGGYDGYIERVRNAARVRALLPMSEMLEWNVDGERAFLAYSQANSLVDFMVATWGKDAVLNVLRRIGNDEKPAEAFQNVLGVSQGELWRRWASSLK